MSDAGRSFLVSCLHCLRPIMLVARIGDDELSRLRQHVREKHPDEVHSVSPGIEATLRHYRVEPEPEAGPPATLVRPRFKRRRVVH
jgi:hypothetical protein